MTPEEALELFAAVPVGILSVTRDGVIRGGNFAAARLLDVPLKALPGRSLLDDARTAADRAALHDVFESGRFDERELPFKGTDGRKRLLRVSGRPLPDGSVAVIVRDPTHDAARERRRLLELKMDALGRLASGVAHEYGNVMAALSGYAQLAVQDPKMKDELVEAVISSAPRVRSVTDALRAFERVPSGEFEPFDLADVVHRVVGILGPEIEKAGAKVERNLAVRGQVLGQRAAIEEAVIAVVRNAIEASRGGGTVTLTLSMDDERVLLLVADTGPGIPDDFRDRVFDPFFTTKGSLGGGQYHSGGGGLGLGLAVAWNILRSHEGDVELVTNVERGTAFRIVLPARRERHARRDTNEKTDTRRTTARRRPRRSILFVDPDPAARALVEAVLKGDHWVRAAATGQEGIDAYDAPRAFDYVVLDVALLGPPSGLEVFEAIKKKDPKARIVLLTHLASDSELVRKCMPQAYALLRKPEGLKDVRDLLT